MYYTLLKYSIVLAAGAAGLYDETNRDRPRLGADRYHEAAGLAPAAPAGGGSHTRNTAG